jgi:hypothetical protein
MLKLAVLAPWLCDFTDMIGAFSTSLPDDDPYNLSFLAFWAMLNAIGQMGN